VAQLQRLAAMQIVGYIAHALHTTCYYYVIYPKGYLLRAHHNGFEARCAYFVDGGSIGGGGYTGMYGGLPHWRLAQTCREHIAHVYRTNVATL
jgi:hypothetical protein